MSLIKATLITPIWKRDKFKPILESIVTNQTYQNIEHIIVEEQSSVNYKFKNARHIIIPSVDNKSLNIGRKRNIALHYSTGDVIINIDSDDYYSPQYVEKVMNFFQKNQSTNFLNMKTMCVYDINIQTYQILSGRSCFGTGHSYRSSITTKYDSKKMCGEDGDFLSKYIERYGRDGLIETNALVKDMIYIRHKENISWLAPLEQFDVDYKFLTSRVADSSIINFYKNYSKG